MSGPNGVRVLLLEIASDLPGPSSDVPRPSWTRGAARSYPDLPGPSSDLPRPSSEPMDNDVSMPERQTTASDSSDVLTARQLGVALETHAGTSDHTKQKRFSSCDPYRIISAMHLGEYARPNVSPTCAHLYHMRSRNNANKLSGRQSAQL